MAEVLGITEEEAAGMTPEELLALAGGQAAESNKATAAPTTPPPSGPAPVSPDVAAASRTVSSGPSAPVTPTVATPSSPVSAPVDQGRRRLLAALGIGGAALLVGGGITTAVLLSDDDEPKPEQGLDTISNKELARATKAVFKVKSVGDDGGYKFSRRSTDGRKRARRSLSLAPLAKGGEEYWVLKLDGAKYVTSPMDDLSEGESIQFDRLIKVNFYPKNKSFGSVKIAGSKVQITEDMVSHKRFEGDDGKSMIITIRGKQFVCPYSMDQLDLEGKSRVKLPFIFTD